MDKLYDNLKDKTGFWRLLPKFLRENTAQAIYPNIYVPWWLYIDLKSDNPAPKNLAIISHELAHLERQKEIGRFRWLFKYAFSRKFRFQEELIAIEAEFNVLKNYGIEPNVEKKAIDLSGSIYLWCVDYEKAITELSDL